MSIDPELLKILACPACRVGVEACDDGLRCECCGRVYPIVDGIPVMIVEEARSPDRPDGSEKAEG